MQTELESIDEAINLGRTSSITRPNLCFVGKIIFSKLEKGMRERVCMLYKDQKFHNLLMPAMEWRGVLIIDSPVMPEDAFMLCDVSEKELSQQKELIGWPVIN